MRLNFSGVDESLIREGIRRLGEVVREQVALYGTLTGGHPARRASSPPPTAERPSARPTPPSSPAAAAMPAAPEEQLANVLPLPRKRA